MPRNRSLKPEPMVVARRVYPIEFIGLFNDHFSIPDDWWGGRFHTTGNGQVWSGNIQQHIPLFWRVPLVNKERGNAVFGIVRKRFKVPIRIRNLLAGENSRLSLKTDVIFHLKKENEVCTFFSQQVDPYGVRCDWQVGEWLTNRLIEAGYMHLDKIARQMSVMDLELIRRYPGQADSLIGALALALEEDLKELVKTWNLGEIKLGAAFKVETNRPLFGASSDTPVSDFPEAWYQPPHADIQENGQLSLASTFSEVLQVLQTIFAVLGILMTILGVSPPAPWDKSEILISICLLPAWLLVIFLTPTMVRKSRLMFQTKAAAHSRAASQPRQTMSAWVEKIRTIVLICMLILGVFRLLAGGNELARLDWPMVLLFLVLLITFQFHWQTDWTPGLIWGGLPLCFLAFDEHFIHKVLGIFAALTFEGVIAMSPEGQRAAFLLATFAPAFAVLGVEKGIPLALAFMLGDWEFGPLVAAVAAGLLSTADLFFAPPGDLITVGAEMLVSRVLFWTALTWGLGRLSARLAGIYHNIFRHLLVLAIGVSTSILFELLIAPFILRRATLAAQPTWWIELAVGVVFAIFLGVIPRLLDHFDIASHSGDTIYE